MSVPHPDNLEEFDGVTSVRSKCDNFSAKSVSFWFGGEGICHGVRDFSCSPFRLTVMIVDVLGSKLNHINNCRCQPKWAGFWNLSDIESSLSFAEIRPREQRSLLAISVSALCARMGRGKKKEIAQRRTLFRLKLRSSASHRFSEAISHLAGFIYLFHLKIPKSKTPKSQLCEIFLYSQ